MKNILFQANDWDYEEGFSIEIFEENGILFIHNTGHCVMIGSWNETREINQEEALEIIEENLQYEDDYYLNFENY